MPLTLTASGEPFANSWSDTTDLAKRSIATCESSKASGTFALHSQEGAQKAYRRLIAHGGIGNSHDPLAGHQSRVTRPHQGATAQGGMGRARGA